MIPMRVLPVDSWNITQNDDDLGMVYPIGFTTFNQILTLQEYDPYNETS